MELRQVLNAVRHQVAAIRQLAGEAMQADARLRAGQEGEDRRRPREEFHVDDGVDAVTPHRQGGVQEIGDERRQRLVANADDVGGRYGADDVEDGAVALEDAEEHVVAADRARRASDGVLREYRRALLDELEEKELARCVWPLALRSREGLQAAKEGQRRAGRY